MGVQSKAVRVLWYRPSHARRCGAKALLCRLCLLPASPAGPNYVA
jgi:hypothetical protein